MAAAAVALREDNAIERPATLMSRAEVLTRYRHFREISKQHHSAALDFLSKDAIRCEPGSDRWQDLWCRLLRRDQNDGTPHPNSSDG